MSRWLAARVVVVGGLVLAGATSAQENVGTLRLDGLSFISLGDREVLPIPSGSSIRFRFGKPTDRGDVPFTISPSDVSILPIPVPSEDGTLLYALAAPASGWLRSAADGLTLEFSASVRATLLAPEGGGTLTYSVPFTTESLVSRSLEGDTEIPVRGARLVRGARYVQIVGATANKANARPEPGAAVYTVLSGTFDWIP